MGIKSIIYEKEIVDNKDPKPMAEKQYYPAYFKTIDDQPIPLLFTKEQIFVAIERAKKNPEDIKERQVWLDELFDTLEIVVE